MSTAPLTGNRAIKYMRKLRAAGYSRKNIGWCARRVREAFGFTYGVGATASAQWRLALRRGVAVKCSPDKAPRGYPGYFYDGRGHGHAVVLLGGGKCIGVDYPKTGEVGVGRIEDVAAWCGKPFVGYARGMGGKRLPGYVKPKANRPKPRKPAGGRK